MDVSTRAVLTAAVAAIVGGAGVLAGIPLVVASALLALVIAIGWPVLLDLPARLGSTVVIALGGVGGVVAVTATRGQPVLRELPVVVAFAILLAFVNELARQDGRHRLVESVTGTVTGVLVATAAAGWVASGRTPGGTSLVVSGAVALAVGAAVSAVPLGGWTAAAVTTTAAVIAGGAVGAVMPGTDVLAGAFLGLATGILVAALHELFDRQPALARRWAALAAIVLPVSVSGILVYVVGRVLVG
ncbi:hypothetical protein ICW40_13280 [Actinotalea ferrariae]|uniref:hypothetical protein n=1 Tax=Actinotalea ferrariae TaxID=1386098 RepID=UPI001C8C24AC|nr:hypothetical protein [Actinotalea ferrariae]MBX9245775.1 hypothetical protein [Actinotalea ferrariae]